MMEMSSPRQRMKMLGQCASLKFGHSRFDNVLGGHGHLSLSN